MAAGPVTAAPDYTLTLTSAFVSQYLLRGERLGGASLQPSFELNSGSLGAGIWANLALHRDDRDASWVELNPYAYYSFVLNQSVSVAPGFTLYTDPSGPDGTSRDARFEPNLTLSCNVAGITFTPKFYYDFEQKERPWNFPRLTLFP